MITVRRSDTGSYVLVHEPSQTVMVGESLEATFARMQEHLRDNPSLPATPAGPTPAQALGPRRAWLLGLGVLAVLPFLWLGVLHYTLGRMIDELRASPPQAEPEQVEPLRSELEALRQQISRVEDEVGAGRPRPARVARPARTRPPAERPADDAADTDPEASRTETLEKARALARERRRRMTEADAKEPPTQP